MRQLSQQNRLQDLLCKENEGVRKAVNRVLERECGIADYATSEIWQELLRRFRAGQRPTYDLVKYRRALHEYAVERLYYGALMRRLERQAKKKRPAPGRPFAREQSHARNLDIAWFVAERVIPFWQLLNGEKLLFGHHGPTAGPPWDALADDWNRVHAADRFGAGRKRTPGDSLKDEYYRARRRLEPELLEQFGDALMEVLREFMRGSEEVGRRIYRQAATTRDELLAQQPLARKPFDTWTRTDEAEWRLWRQKEIQAYRDALTLQDLIRHHLCRVRMLGDPSGGKQQYHRAPLRPWFLIEVREARGEPVVDWDAFLRSFDPLTEVFQIAGGPGRI